jgi:vacuolar-type H+-ATPase subunit F/Vma7
MSHVLRVVCRPSLAAGFALAGVPALPASDPKEAATLVLGLAARADVGVVLVEESLFAALPDARRRALERQPLPVVIPVPGPRAEGAPPAERHLVELLQRAIGYRVRL